MLNFLILVKVPPYLGLAKLKIQYTSDLKIEARFVIRSATPKIPGTWTAIGKNFLGWQATPTRIPFLIG